MQGYRAYVYATKIKHAQNATVAIIVAGLEEPLGNDQHVTRPQGDVLVRFRVLHDVLEVDLHEDLLVAVPADQSGAPGRRELGEAAGQGHELQEAERLGL